MISWSESLCGALNKWAGKSEADAEDPQGFRGAVAAAAWAPSLGKPSPEEVWASKGCAEKRKKTEGKISGMRSVSVCPGCAEGKVTAEGFVTCITPCCCRLIGNFSPRGSGPSLVLCARFADSAHLCVKYLSSLSKGTCFELPAAPVAFLVARNSRLVTRLRRGVVPAPD